jgi:hypothetical protein
MPIIFIRNKHLKELSNLMTAFLEEARALLNNVANGAADAAETKEAVKALEVKLTENSDLDEEQSTIIKELLEKLAASTPTEPTA